MALSQKIAKNFAEDSSMIVVEISLVFFKSLSLWSGPFSSWKERPQRHSSKIMIPHNSLISRRQANFLGYQQTINQADAYCNASNFPISSVYSYLQRGWESENHDTSSATILLPEKFKSFDVSTWHSIRRIRLGWQHYYSI